MQIEPVYFFVAAILTILSISVLLVRRNLKTLFFSIFIVFIAYYDFYYGLYFSGLLADYPFLFLTYPVLVTQGNVVYYLFTRLALDDSYKLNYRTLFHFIIPTIHNIHIFQYILQSPEEKRSFFLQYYQARVPEAWPLEADKIFFIFFNSFYVILSIYYIFRNTKLLKYIKNPVNPAMLNKYMIYIFSFTLLLFLYFGSLPFFFDKIGIYKIYPLILSTGLPIILLMLLFYPYAIQLGLVVATGSEFSITRYARSHLTGVNLVSLEEKLQKLFEENKIFKEENLTMPDIAGRVGLTTHQFSEYLNVVKNLSYTEYIREYRIREAIAIMEMQKKYQITRIGFECGFNSLSAFYDAFKDKMGMSPGDFKKKLKSSL